MVEALACVVEEEWPGALCSFFQVDSENSCFYNVAAPSLPGELILALGDFKVKEELRSEGDRSIKQEVLIVSDMESDPIWKEDRSIALKWGLKACWSIPIVSRAQELLGLLVIYHKEIKVASQKEIERMKSYMHFASLVFEHHITQVQLREERDRAKAASEAKGLFLANMSHEIRTPMNGVLSMAELLADTKLDKAQEEMLQMIQSSGSHLLEIINDILDFSKIAEDKVSLYPQPTDLRKLATDIEKLFYKQSRQKSVTIFNSFRGPVDTPVLVDCVRLQQVLVNLISNAIKFSPNEEKVVFLVDAKESQASYLEVFFSISDFGIGVSKEQRERIFEEFSQADETITREFGGTGLGLSIAQKLVKLLGGNLELESSLGRGSSFFFSLNMPIAETVAQTEELSEHIQIAPCKILVAEDNKVNQKLIFRILEKLGHQVTIADDGAKAVKAFSENSFDLVMLDIQMPVMSGEEALKQIRMHEKGMTTPIIAITAHAMKGDREHYLKIGMDGYVSKPIKRDLLMQEMSKVLALRK